MGYNDKKVVLVETKVENCEKSKVDVISSFLITRMSIGNKSTTFMRRVKSACDSTSAYADLWQAHAQTMLVLGEGLAELGIMEIDHVELEFRTNTVSIANKIFQKGDKYVKAQKWSDKDSMNDVKRRIVQITLGVLHSLIKRFKTFGGSITVNNAGALDKKTKVAEEFKKLTNLSGGKREYNKNKIEKLVVTSTSTDKKLLEMAVENGYDTDSDRLFDEIMAYYKVEKQRRIREAAKANAIKTGRFRNAQ